MESANVTVGHRVPWNKGKLTGQKPPLKLGEIWAIRTRLQMTSNVRELAMFNLAIDTKLRACDLTRLQVQDIRHGSHVAARSTVMQQRPSVRCNSRSRSKPVRAWKHGSRREG